MKLHGITLVKNEADILSDVLAAAAEWADHIYVLDNGSTDGSWQIVQDLAQANPVIIPVRQERRSYSNLLRREVFEEFKDRAEPADWWCKLDADEFYVDHPHRFLARVPDRFRMVFGSSFQYRFTDRDRDAHAADPEAWERMPVREKLRYYRNDHSEPRFVRHGPGVWDSGHPQDEPVYPVRIWLRHYQYRSPRQIQSRLESRLAANRDDGSFRHEANGNRGRQIGAAGPGVASWESRVIPAANLDHDAGDGRLVPREDLLWPLPEPGLKSEFARLAQRVPTHLRRRLSN